MNIERTLDELVGGYEALLKYFPQATDEIKTIEELIKSVNDTITIVYTQLENEE